jgi:ketosteroid isomerase-like protein
MFKSKQAALLATTLATTLAVLAGCAQKAPDTAAIEAMITAHTTAWIDAYNAGDADKTSASYADDAVLMAPDAPAAVGKDAIKQMLATDMAASKAAGVSFALDGGDAFGVSGDLAWHSGNIHVNGPAGTSLGTGKFLEVWHQGKDAQGKPDWQIVRDTWNMDAAPPPPPPPVETKKPAPKKAETHKSKSKKKKH